MSDLIELYSFIARVIPFGVPTDTNINNIKKVIMRPYPQTENIIERQPAWKPHSFKGRQKLEFIITETIVAVQYDSENIENVYQINGEIKCRADLEGFPEITLKLPTSNPLNIIQTHSAITNPDFNTSKKLVFSPPLSSFHLLTYSLLSIPDIPIRGYFQMHINESGQAQVLLQLKLNTDIPNNFQYCRISIPFSREIASIVPTHSEGNVKVNEENDGLVWDIGQRFVGRRREASLPVIVNFIDAEITGDPFIVDSNCCAKIEFRILDYTISGIKLDEKCISVARNSSSFTPKFETSCQTFEYLIWNSWGDVKYSRDPFYIPE
eukprot:TRINITY_DN1094_c0_g1_i1.p1 TRINITY_DN1094_c0_g1~~TRINITY_DN1094_c0_g1_i1.p1  ORF type:complete len:323 (+),score=68.83 TRINITY_DN1094_c0_g1_i1:439-1407(+)